MALIVVPGVGDDAPGQTLEAVSSQLAQLREFKDAERHELVLPVRERGQVAYRTSWATLPATGAGCQASPERRAIASADAASRSRSAGSRVNGARSRRSQPWAAHSCTPSRRRSARAIHALATA
jgi:hypothetical protein